MIVLKLVFNIVVFGFFGLSAQGQVVSKQLSQFRPLFNVIHCSNKLQISKAAYLAVETGISCLSALGTKQAQKHIQGLKQKLSQSYQLQCIDQDLGITGAFSYLNGNELYIPQNTSSHLPPSLIFHELFHSIGHKHLDGVEYASACQACCFENEDGGLKKAACRICSKEYKNPNENIEYLKDLQKFSNASAQSPINTQGLVSVTFHPVPLWILQMSEKKNNRQALANIIASLAMNRWQISNQVAKGLLEIAIANEKAEIFQNLNILLQPHFVSSRLIYNLQISGQQNQLNWQLEKKNSELKKSFKNQQLGSQESQQIINQIQSAIYSCYVDDKAKLEQDLEFLIENRALITDLAFNSPEFFSALSRCRYSGSPVVQKLKHWVFELSWRLTN